MTTGNLSALIGGGASASGVLTDLKDMPVCIADPSLKTNSNLNETASSPVLFTSLALRGASGSVAVADTYLTLCDITGSGVLINVLGPTHSVVFTGSVRITYDGIVKTISIASIPAGRRLLVGPYTNGMSQASPPESVVTGPNQFLDYGFDAALVNGVPRAASAGIPTPEQAIMYGMPRLRFANALKVEVKASLLSATAVHKQCGVTYRLDI
jgi:hypothetical protein